LFEQIGGFADALERLSGHIRPVTASVHRLSRLKCVPAQFTVGCGLHALSLSLSIIFPHRDDFA